MILLLLASPVLALPPSSAGTRGEVVVARGADGATPAGGALVEGELPVTDHARVGAELGFHLGGGGSSTALILPEVGWYFNTPWRRGPAVAGVAALGVQLSDRPGPAAAAGVRLDLGLNDRWGLRVQSDVLFDLTEGPVAVRLGVGPQRIFRKPEPPPPLPPVHVGFEPADARAWIDHPGCGWHPVQELLIKPGDISPETSLVLHASGYLPARATLATLAETRMVRAPEQGGLVIVGWPGDRVRVDGHAITLNEEGVAVVHAAPGATEVTFEGGGRQDEQLAAVAEGYATWVRGSRPAPVRVDFAQGSAQVSSSDRRTAALLAQRAGGWAFQIQGSASPEGDRARNQELAAQRAQAVQQALIDAGLPAERLVLLPPEVQLYGTPETLRYVQITPISPEAAR